MRAKDEEGRYVIFTDLPEGNAHSIMAIVVDMLKQIYGEDAPEHVERYRADAESSDYENLKRVSIEAVPGLLTFENSEEFEVIARKK